MTLQTQIRIGPLVVLIDTHTGNVVAVQDYLTKCAAALMYSKGTIAHATQQATLAWASITEPA